MAKNNTDKEMEAAGAGIALDEESIKTITDLANTIKMLEGYVNDQVIQDLAGMIAPMSKLANAASSTDFVNIAERAVQDPDLDKALLNPKKGGIIDIAKKMNDKDVRRGMYIMLEFLRAMGKASRESL